MPRKVLPAICAASALIGCGSSAALSKSDLIAKSDAICKRLGDGIKHVGATNTAADVARVAPKVHSLEQQGVDDLRKLTPPKSLATDYASFVKQFQVLTDDTTKIGAAAKSKDQKAAQVVVSEATSASASVTGTAAKLGFKDCSRQQ